jgi:hypothetical protein
MKLTISEACQRIIAQPAPVLFLDTCNLIDLIRIQKPDEAWPMEVNACLQLLSLLQASSAEIHLVLSEVVLNEFERDSDELPRKSITLEKDVEKIFDQARICLEVAASLGLNSHEQLPFDSKGFAAALIALPINLLENALVLTRDTTCLDRALTRLLSGKMPSKDKRQIKDSIVFEHSLELCRELQTAALQFPKVFVSRNTGDYCIDSHSSRVHPDLASEFSAAGMTYETTIRTTIGKLMKQGYFKPGG